MTKHVSAFACPNAYPITTQHINRFSPCVTGRQRFVSMYPQGFRTRADILTYASLEAACFGDVLWLWAQIFQRETLSFRMELYPRMDRLVQKAGPVLQYGIRPRYLWCVEVLFRNYAAMVIPTAFRPTPLWHETNFMSPEFSAARAVRAEILHLACDTIEHGIFIGMEQHRLGMCAAKGGRV